MVGKKILESCSTGSIAFSVPSYEIEAQKLKKRQEHRVRIGILR